MFGSGIGYASDTPEFQSNAATADLKLYIIEGESGANVCSGSGLTSVINEAPAQPSGAGNNVVKILPSGGCDVYPVPAQDHGTYRVQIRIRAELTDGTKLNYVYIQFLGAKDSGQYKFYETLIQNDWKMTFQEDESQANLKIYTSVDVTNQFNVTWRDYDATTPVMHIWNPHSGQNLYLDAVFYETAQ